LAPCSFPLSQALADAADADTVREDAAAAGTTATRLPSSASRAARATFMQNPS
jgi:hypothetical protein